MSGFSGKRMRLGEQEKPSWKREQALGLGTSL